MNHSVQINSPAKWIWLAEKDYPNRQKTMYSAMIGQGDKYPYTVARFERTFSGILGETLEKAILRVSGDTAYTLQLNGKQIQRGPAAVGGDFLYNEEPQPNFYAYCTDETERLKQALLESPEGVLSFVATVRLKPVLICDFSKGQGGFYMDLELTDREGKKIHLGTDGTWMGRLLSGYCSPTLFDGGLPQGPDVPSQELEDLWHVKDAPILPCHEYGILEKKITVKAGETFKTTLLLDWIEACFVHAKIKAKGPVQCRICCRETSEEGTLIQLKTHKDCQYDGFELISIGEVLLEVENESKEEAVLEFSLTASHYPVKEQASLCTDDPELNQVIETCTHTLKICRQTHHLDSPKHCEPLACTGDYYIETLMTAASFGDMSLAAFDVERTAELLRHHQGRMFHTSYSLIWVLMLKDVFLFTGKKELLQQNEDALDLLFNRFSTYLGDNGLLETPPDYMFVDWLYPEGINMHHPPKCLGQTVLNLFYYGALKTGAEIKEKLGKGAEASQLLLQAKQLKQALMLTLWDEEKGLFREGLTTPTPDYLLAEYMPQNRNQTYYMKHSAILASYFGFFSEEQNRKLLHRVLGGEKQIFATEKIQPYFLHFLLEAIYRNGLREEYTLKELEKWKAPVKECKKGLVEGFYPPEQGYQFDHSHAWGGTPVWSLTQALSGLKILEPGFKVIELAPSLLGLSQADLEIPTPYGRIQIRQRKGEKPEIQVPKGITLKHIFY